MAKPTKRRIDGEGPAPGSSRVTPKGGPTKAAPRSSSSQGRYTPPSPNAHMPSPMWVPVLMFSLFGLGTLAIVLNYSEVIPGSPSGWYLLGGLGGILAGIITATQLR